jgi:hypothetical protein
LGLTVELAAVGVVQTIFTTVLSTLFSIGARRYGRHF